ncbi:MAG: hotdog domain-containing protein [Victivallaceae bacterium]
MEKIMSLLCKHMDTGACDRLFGGKMLFYLDEAAAVYAYGLVGKGVNLVTYRFGEIIFRRPVKLNEVMNFCGGEPSFSRHSVSFKLRVDVEGEVCLETDVTMVSVDGTGKKVALPALLK